MCVLGYVSKQWRGFFFFHGACLTFPCTDGALLRSVLDQTRLS